MDMMEAVNGSLAWADSQRRTTV